MTPTPLALNTLPSSALPPAEFTASESPPPQAGAPAPAAPAIASLVSSALPSLHQLHWCLSKAESSLPRGTAPAALDSHRERELTRCLLAAAAALEAQCLLWCANPVAA